MAFYQTKELINHVFGVDAPDFSETRSAREEGFSAQSSRSGMYLDPTSFFGRQTEASCGSPVGVYYSRKPKDKYKKDTDNNGPIENKFIKTGFPDLDKLLGELKAGSLTLIAGLPGVGKTSLALNIAEHTATHAKTPVGIFSLDIGREELLTRLISACSRVRLESIYSGFITSEERKDLDATLESLYLAPIHIDDNTNHSLASIREQLKECKGTLGLKLLIIDCLQLIKNTKHSEKALREISQELKELAREFSVAIIALYQLPQSWQSKKIIPHPSFILSHGAAKTYNADNVILIYRRSVCRECQSPIELCTCSLDHDTRLVVSGGAAAQEVTHLRFLTDSVHFEIPA